MCKSSERTRARSTTAFESNPAAIKESFIFKSVPMSSAVTDLTKSRLILFELLVNSAHVDPLLSLEGESYFSEV